MINRIVCKLRGFLYCLLTGQSKVLKSVSLGKIGRISGRVILGGQNSILWGARIEATGNGKIVIGKQVNIQQSCHITCGELITLGDNTAITANVTITDIIHPYQDINVAPVFQPIETRPVVIGNNCLISNNAVILPGTELGNHTVVAANSVVCGLKTSGFCVVAGSPASIVKQYDFATNKWVSTREHQVKN